MKQLSRLVNFWNEDRSLTVMLVLLLLFIFVLVPGLGAGAPAQLLMRIIYSVMLLTGIMSVAKRKNTVAVIVIMAIISFITTWLTSVEKTPVVMVVHDLGVIFFNAVFLYAILIKTFRQGEITYHRVVGSVVVYLLFGFIFTYVFHIIYLLAGETSFNNVKGNDLKDFLYFSFTSLSTMGYGDITPVYPFARALANLEALIGQLYPAILIARLVSMEVASSIQRREKNMNP